mgnify:CR=1 FL=1
MTPAQLQTLGAYIASQQDLAAFPANNDGAFEIAALLNAAASPAFYVWRTSVTVDEIMQNGFD